MRYTRGIIYRRFFVLCLLLFFVLTALVYSGTLRHFDISNRVIIRQIIPEPIFLPIADFLDQAFKFRLVVPIFLLILSMLAFNLKGLKILCIFFSMFAIEVLSKIIIPQHTLSGPYVKNFGDFDVARFPYPSGHVARTVFFSFLFLGMMKRFFWFHKKRWIAYIVFVSLIIVVSVSRIYLFRHWFADVLGGLFLGAGFGMIAYYLVIPNGQQKRS